MLKHFIALIMVPEDDHALTQLFTRTTDTGITFAVIQQGVGLYGYGTHRRYFIIMCTGVFLQ